MTIINVNSISGISSITAQGASGIEFFDSSGNSVQTVTGDGLTVGTGASVHNPASNVLTLGTNNEERVRITSDGDVGINDANPSDALTVYKTNVGNPAGITIRNTEASSTYSHARLRLESQNGAAYGEIWADVANAGLRLGYNSSSTVKIDSTGNIVLLNGKGIDFSATADGSGASNVSELLDDYEEGTFTPTFNTTNSNVGTISYDSSNTRGEYVKIGRKVFITLVTRTTGISGSAGTGDVILSGLPFAPDNTVSPRPVCSISEIGTFGSWGTAPVTTSPPTIWGLNYIKLFSTVLSTANPGNFFMLSGTYVTTA